MNAIPRSARSRPTRAFATVVVLVILCIMALLVAINGDSVSRAFREVRLVEQRQLRQHPWLITNAVNQPTVPR